MQREAVRRREQHLEEHEQVEQVAGEERAVHAHQQELHERVEARARALPAREREHERCDAEHGGEQHHDGGQPVDDQHDAERRRPSRRGDRRSPPDASATPDERDADRDEQQRPWRG